MNLFEKIFCRAFQLCFKAAQPLLPYREPKLFDSVDGVAGALASDGTRAALIVTDSVMVRSEHTSRLRVSLKENGIKPVIYSDTCPNPTTDNVDEALKLYREEKCTAIIAIGGGSPIDCAKAVGILAVYPKKRLSQMKGILKVHRKLPPIVAIPTTAGTGSEVTVTAVITDRAKREKYTISDFSLIPKYAVHDPSITYSLPQHLTATTGMDALTHAVEAYIGRSTCRTSRSCALDAVKLVFDNIERAYTDSYDTEARRNMLIASYKAGRAFSISYVGYIHAVAHSLGGMYNTPHGLANTVIMPYVLEYYGPCAHKKLHCIAVAAGVADERDSHAEGAAKFIEAIRELNRKMGVPDKLSGIKREDIPMMARHAAAEANPLYPVPRLMNAAELEKIYGMISE